MSGSGFNDSGMGCTPLSQAQLDSFAEQWGAVIGARGVGAAYAAERLAHVRKVLKLTGYALSDTAVQIAIGALAQTGLSNRSLNKHQGAMKQFTRWLARPSLRAIPYDPLSELRERNVEKDRRHERTVFSSDAWLKLFTATLNSKRLYRGICGRDRAEVYHAAACTGLREGAIPKLEVGQFDLSGPVGILNVRAEQLKGPRDLVIPIQADSTARLRRYLADKMPTVKAFRCPPHKWDFIRMLVADLREAGVAYCRTIEMENGKTRRRDVLDFHALRHTFGTRNASAGNPLTTTQRMMGHSDPSLTANLYTHVLTPEFRDAALRLPALPGLTG